MFKDEVLEHLAARGANIAQFISFAPTLKQRFSRLNGRCSAENDSLESRLSNLIRFTAERSVNIRSYQPENPKSREFVYGVQNADEAAAKVRSLAEQGLYTIVNETIDVSDGGVSGVAHGNAIEFAPDDTPRCVEKAGTAALRRDAGLRLLQTVYQFPIDLEFGADHRVEFSIHPKRRGIKNTHTIVWEVERQDSVAGTPRTIWPNRFSKLIGDKTFGLLVGSILGLPVPRTTVLNRRVAPFSFGDSTGTGEFWTRTAPILQQPGKFTTLEGWTDPFKLISAEDLAGDQIASVLSQESVASVAAGGFSWASKESGISVFVEGVNGTGDRFMMGEQPPDRLQETIIRDVTRTAEACRSLFGLCRGEWVFDGNKVWIVQLHRLFELIDPQVIVPGEAAEFRPFVVSDGLEALRSLVQAVASSNDGIELIGEVGITSHFGDVLRQARIPSRFAAIGMG